jgi:hypothetical protein
MTDLEMTKLFGLAGLILALAFGPLLIAQVLFLVSWYFP